MTGFEPRVYRNLMDGVGSPGDPANTDSTSSWTMVAPAQVPTGRPIRALWRITFASLLSRPQKSQRR